MQDAFVKNFEGTCSRATTIEDLERCIQGPRESTRRWVNRWQDLWNASSGISPDTAIHIFKSNCRYEPLVAKLRRHGRTIITIPDLMMVAKRYADDTKDNSDDEPSRGRH